jgi:hypothetical protein
MVASCRRLVAESPEYSRQSRLTLPGDRAALSLRRSCRPADHRAIHALEVCVADDGAGGEVPHVRDEPFAEDGRGIVIVTALAAEWGVEAERDGTTTWFRLRG